MPFEETYSVNFGNGNRDLKPYLNLMDWSPMQLSRSPAPDEFSDPLGLKLTLTRDPTATTTALNSVFLSLPIGKVPLNTRLLMRVTFDLPRAESFPFPESGNAESIAKRSTSERSPSDTPGIPSPSVGLTISHSVPEPWAVALNVSAENSIPISETGPSRMVNLTCQFNRKLNGVRLNTPGSLQTDQAANLESPLNYDSYQGGPGLPTPLFTLEHSFCGWNFDATHPVAGAGSLKISRSEQSEVHDHRVYSSSTLSSATPPVTIGALGRAWGGSLCGCAPSLCFSPICGSPTTTSPWMEGTTKGEAAGFALV